MSKWYEVQKIAYETVLIETPDNEGDCYVVEIALDEGRLSDLDAEIDTRVREVPEHELEEAKRLADFVIPLNGDANDR